MDGQLCSDSQKTRWDQIENRRDLLRILGDMFQRTSSGQRSRAAIANAIAFQSQLTKLVRPIKRREGKSTAKDLTGRFSTAKIAE